MAQMVVVAVVVVIAVVFQFFLLARLRGADEAHDALSWYRGRCGWLHNLINFWLPNMLIKYLICIFN